MTTLKHHQTFEIKSQLARLLSIENITVQHKTTATTAYFDVKNRILCLPVWQDISEDLYDMLVVHETGHAIDTPTEGWLQTIEKIANKYYADNPSNRAKIAVKDYLNIIEDARIDKRQKRRFPGSKRNYVIGLKELMNRDFFGIANKDVNSLSLIDRINIHFKSTASQIKFTKEEQEFVNRIADAETFEDVIVLTDELFGYCIEQKRKLLSETNKIYENEEIELEFDTYGEYDDADDLVDDQDEDYEISETRGNNSDSDENHDKDIPESETENSIRKNMQSIIKNDDVEYVYCTIPTPKISIIVDDFTFVIPEMEQELKSLTKKTQEYQKVSQIAFDEHLRDFHDWKNKENETISFMIKEFEMKKAADIYNRVSVSKTGVIDTNKLYSYRYNDDIFRKMSVVPTGKSHGFVMLLDWSGSMHSNISSTLKQLFSLVLFCKRVQIPFDVYLFRSTTQEEEFLIKKSGGCFVYKNNDIVMDNFKLRNILSSRMNHMTLNKAMENLWSASRWSVKCDPMDSTPLNAAIISLTEIIKDFQKKTKVQIVNTIILTDGSSDPHNGIYEFKGGFKKYMFIVRDNETGISMHANSRSLGELTSMFLRILKAKTNTNLVGFFLYSGPFRGLDAYIHSLDITPYQKSWHENGYIGLNSSGYDEYFIIDIIKNRQVVNNLVIDKNMTKSRVVKEFMKFSSKKIINRVLLSKFISRISKSVA